MQHGGQILDAEHEFEADVAICLSDHIQYYRRRYEDSLIVHIETPQWLHNTIKKGKYEAPNTIKKGKYEATKLLYVAHSLRRYAVANLLGISVEWNMYQQIHDSSQNGLH